MLAKKAGSEKMVKIDETKPVKAEKGSQAMKDKMQAVRARKKKVLYNK